MICPDYNASETCQIVLCVFCVNLLHLLLLRLLGCWANLHTKDNLPNSGNIIIGTNHKFMDPWAN